MPSTISTPITLRIPNEYLPALRREANRHGLTTSRAASLLIETQLAEWRREQNREDTAHQR